MKNKIILASKSKVRKEILDKNNIIVQVEPSNVNEEPIKQSLLKENALPEIISEETFINLLQLQSESEDTMPTDINDIGWEDDDLDNDDLMLM